ncbi:hypothetical protein SAMN05428952_101840 [Nitrosomonas sp. Nm132]|nr:hypothetical protein SAMN05428952_101840 [Nitrosomonas sp. Nm132]
MPLNMTFRFKNPLYALNVLFIDLSLRLFPGRIMHWGKVR